MEACQEFGGLSEIQQKAIINLSIALCEISPIVYSIPQRMTGLYCQEHTRTNLCSVTHVCIGAEIR